MAEPAPAADVLSAILSVLERIEERLDKQEQRFSVINGAPQRPRQGMISSPASEADLAELAEADEQPAYPPSLSSCEAVDSRRPAKPEVLYSDLGFSRHGPDHNETFKGLLETYIGDCWKLPDDKRLPLNFSNRLIDWTHDAWDPKSTISASLQEAVVQGLEQLRRFDRDLRAHPGNDFFIIDYDSRGSCRLYRVGDKAVGPELRVSLQEPSHHQWSRLILYQGMTTGSSIKPRSEIPGHRNAEPIPYFSRNGADAGLWSHLTAHLKLKRRPTTTNPYLNPSEGFHTTFYEIREAGPDESVKELWKHGPLYDHPLGWSFRKSAYTLYGPPQLEAPEAFASPGSRSLVQHWTLLLLAPDHFFNENNLSFPIHSQTPQRVETLSHPFGRLHSLGAEMNLIAQGLEKISERWADFQSFFDYTLDGGDSLMQPSEHDNLLFDDGAFSRSRRYFWAIDCLSEFDVSISDNISQWELYKAARILPLLAINALPHLDYRQYKSAEKQCRILHVQREYFRQKLTSTKALRDALFNASAVIESRASTRLGANVKLLTFVNIFFLPLTFCTSLWSINNQFSITSFTITIILVAFFTYLTMFNVNSLVQLCGSLYDAKKKDVVRAMKADSDERWKQRGRRFEAFRPKHEHPEPSEWYIPLYTLLRPATLLGIDIYGDNGNLPTTSNGRQSSFGLAGISNLLRRRRTKPVEPERPEEGWVL